MKNLKRTIAIVCGGDSSEHDVSMRSARGLYSFFDKERYNAYIVEMKGVDWHVELGDGTMAPIDRNDFSFIENGKLVQFDYAYITIEPPHGSTIRANRQADVFHLLRAIDNGNRPEQDTILGFLKRSSETEELHIKQFTVQRTFSGPD